MRFYFPNLTRPKKASKLIAEKLGVPLTSIQTATARILGYSNWHDLEKNHSKQAASLLDQNLEHSDFVERQAQFTLELAEALQIPNGDAQYALAGSRLIGDRPKSLSDQVDIRLRCWRLTELPLAKTRTRGALGQIKSLGRKETAILKSFGRPTTAITQKNVSGVADFEYISPKQPSALFLPMRLYLPYGYWIEDNGAKVLFSRDYKPMWRIRANLPVERLEPWLWIKRREMVHLWEEAHTPWDSMELRLRMESYLDEMGIHTLPILADALPLLVHDDNLNAFSQGADALRSLRIPPMAA